MTSLIHRFAAAVTAAMLSGLVAGCQTSRPETNDAYSIYQLAKAAFSGPPKVSLQEAASSPYASIGIQVGRSPQVMLILASDNAGEQLWTSAARVAVTTKNGRIIRLVGLGHDVSSFDLRADQRSEISVISWLSDFPARRLYGVRFICESRFVGDETIVILGENIHARRFDEDCHAADIGWSFSNTFWRDPTSGLVWRSRQNVSPSLGPIEIEVFRPPE